MDYKRTNLLTRVGAGEAREAHNLKVNGSKPLSALMSDILGIIPKYFCLKNKQTKFLLYVLVA